MEDGVQCVYRSTTASMSSYSIIQSLAWRRDSEQHALGWRGMLASSRAIE